ncbi:hypothetical protein [Nocardioides sp. GXZ039]|uniref:hypothetical protein n=1 Tax=Nocardioides sp. GXZ039 TaxID=3136018 RepID=UPI0030F3A898
MEAGADEAAVRPGIEDRAESGAVLKADVFARGNEVPAVPYVVVNDQPVTADGDPSNLVQAAIRATRR